MKAKYFPFSMLLVIMLECCSTSKHASVISNTQNHEFEIYIADFSKTKLYKKGNVFFIQSKNSLKNNSLMVVTISKYNGKILYKKTSVAGSKGTMPSRYYEKNGTLFFWWDDTCQLTDETLSVFRKHNLLQDDEDGKYTSPYYHIKETQKGADYFICKNKTNVFKRVITNIGLGFYTPPELNCSN